MSKNNLSIPFGIFVIISRLWSHCCCSRIKQFVAHKNIYINRKVWYENSLNLASWVKNDVLFYDITKSCYIGRTRIKRIRFERRWSSDVFYSPNDWSGFDPDDPVWSASTKKLVPLLSPSSSYWDYVSLFSGRLHLILVIQFQGKHVISLGLSVITELCSELFPQVTNECRYKNCIPYSDMNIQQWGVGVGCIACILFI